MNSFLTLFRMSTGEDWYKIAFDTTRDSNFGCDKIECEGSSINYI